MRASRARDEGGCVMSLCQMPRGAEAHNASMADDKIEPCLNRGTRGVCVKRRATARKEPAARHSDVDLPL